MLNGWREPVTLVTAVGCGLVGGVFFAFSAFVMPALRGLPVPDGISAMQAINIHAPRAALGTALVLPALGAAALVGAALLGHGKGRTALVVGGAILYLVGSLGVAGGLNVPLNDTLAAVDPTTAAGSAVWREYLTDWTRWNHVRATSSLLASAMFALALR